MALKSALVRRERAEIPPLRAGGAAAADERTARRRRRDALWSGARSTRVRIMASFVILLTLSAVLSVVVIRTLLINGLNERMVDAGQQEVLELDRLLAVGEDPETGQPFTTPLSLFDAYLARNVPSHEEALLTFVNGEFHRSQLARYPLDRLPREQFAAWAATSIREAREPSTVSGTFETELGTAHYRVRRVVLGGTAGALVVTTLPAAELADIAEIQIYGVAATLGILLLASGVAWFVAGRVLAPVRLLTDTARSISQSDLTRRIEVRGSDEAAEMARSFNAMLDRLEAIFRGQRQFVQDASHELRDPLTICSGHLELLSDDPAERTKTIELVLDELERMGRTVDDLQVLADTGQPDFVRLEAIDIGTFTHELAAKLSALAPRRWTLDASGDGTFLADRHRLTEAMINLAQNAVQHTEADDTIGIGTSLTPTELRLWVRDQGVGIPLEEQTRVFTPFTRGRGARRRYRGSGLGLAIVKAIAEAHGGRVALESAPGEGARFTIILPPPEGEGAPDDADPDR